MSESATIITNRPTLTTVVLHEESAANEHVGTILRVVETMFGEVTDIRVKQWSFHHLERLDVRAMACHQGKEAAILIVCSSSDKSIPESVATWMERTYQSTLCSKPLIIRLQKGDVAEDDYIQKIASTWKVPLLSDFSLGSSNCWENLRQFLDKRLHNNAKEDETEDLLSEKTRKSPSCDVGENELCPMNQAIRDRAYQLWVSAGRPDGRNIDFWHEAEREIQLATPVPEAPRNQSQAFPNPKTHENTTATSNLRCRPTPDLMYRIPSDATPRPSNALLQHLARIPQELLATHFHSRGVKTSPTARQKPTKLLQRGRRLSAFSDLSSHTLSPPMIIRLDWFGCEPTTTKEQRIHRALETLQSIKPISRASVRVEEQTNESPSYHLTLMLTMPGPDVLAHGAGHTFEEALRKLEDAALKTLEHRAKKARQLNGAVRGVKALHRG